MSFASSDERYFARLVNDIRGDLGLDPLRIEMHLNAAAEDHSQWMLARDVFSHTGARGSSSRERMEAAGFDLAGHWRTAENIAYISVTGGDDLRDEVRALHQMLVDSPGHYANIVNPDLTMIGIGLQVGSFTRDGRDYTVLMATQNFGDTDGDVRMDNGRFQSARLPMPDLDGPVRAEWRQEFDGDVILPTHARAMAMGGDGNDDFRGRGGGDAVNGGGGDDWLRGRGGRDQMEGGAGDDCLLGDAGDDRLRGDGGNDMLLGGAGRDALIGGVGRDMLNGGGADDVLFGGAGNDRLVGQAGNDRLAGGGGRDWLAGGAGNDRLIAGGGNDTLSGGTGNDVLVGGGGADCFVFAEGDGEDRIVGYQQGQDRLMIDGTLTGRDALRFADNHIRQTDAGVVISFGDGDRIVLIGDDLDPLSVASDIFTV